MDAGAEPVFAFYLGNLVNEKIDHRCCQQRTLHVVIWTCFAPTKLARLHDTLQISNQSSRGERHHGKKMSFALLASKQTQHAVDAIDTVLFKCDKECKLLSTVTRLFCSVQTLPIVYALFTILPRALGTEVFLRGRSDLNIGASR